jgi:WD40 repeat protein
MEKDHEKLEYILANLPHHLFLSIHLDKLIRLLTSYTFLYLKITHYGIEDIINDFNYAQDLKMLQDILIEASHILEVHPEQLPSQIIGRSGLDFNNDINIQSLLTQIMNWHEKSWLKPQRGSLSLHHGALLRSLVGHQEGVMSLALSPDEKLLFSGEGKQVSRHSQPDYTIRVWEIGSFQTIHILKGHEADIKAIAIDPDSGLLISGSSDGTIIFWDLSNFSIVKRLRCHSDSIDALDVLHRRSIALSGSSDGTIKIWNLKDTSVLHTITGHKGRISSLAISSDTRLVASAGSDYVINIWDTNSWKILRSLRGHKETIWSLHFLKDNRQLLSSAGFYYKEPRPEDATIRIWDIFNGSHRIINGHTVLVSSARTLLEDKVIVSSDGAGNIAVWEFSTGKKIACIKGHSEMINALVSTKDSHRLFSASDDKSIKIWDLKNMIQQGIAGTDKRKGYRINKLYITKDSKRIVSWENSLSLYTPSISNVVVWDVESEEIVYSLIKENKNVVDMSFAQKASILFVLYNNHELQTFDINKGELLFAIYLDQEIKEDEQCSSYHMIDVSDDGNICIISSREGAVYHHSVHEHVIHFYKIDSERFGRPIISHCGNIVFIPAREGYVHINLKTRMSVFLKGDLHLRPKRQVSEVERLNNVNHDAIRKIIVNKDDSLLICILVTGALELWDLINGKQTHIFSGHIYNNQSSRVNEIIIDEEDQYAFSVGDDYTIRKWDLSSGKEVLTLHVGSNNMDDIQFFRNNRFIISLSRANNSIMIWDVVTGGVVASLNSDSQFQCLAVPPDSSFIAIGGRDGNIQFIYPIGFNDM